MTLPILNFIFGRKSLIPLSAMILLLSCAGTQDGLILTEEDNGRAVTVKRGDSFTLRLKAQLSTGYNWKIINYNTKIMLVGKPEIETLKKDVTGGIDYQTYIVETRESGEGEIVLHYVQPWQKKVKPLQAYRITVKVE